jgi:hypothetical protein
VGQQCAEFPLIETVQRQEQRAAGVFPNDAGGSEKRMPQVHGPEVALHTARGDGSRAPAHTGAPRRQFDSEQTRDAAIVFPPVRAQAAELMLREGVRVSLHAKEVLKRDSRAR